jgi:hypothetical protein
MALPATDDFAGSGALSANWTAQLNSIARSSGVALGQTGAANSTAFWNADAFANDQYSQCVMTAAFSGIGVRMAGTGGGADGYFMVGVSSAPAALYRLDNGVFTFLQTVGATVNGDTLKLTIESTTLKAYINGVQTGTDQVDATYASGSAGILCFDTTGAVDNWEGGNVGAPVARPKRLMLLGCG